MGLGRPRKHLNCKDRGRREEGGISGLPGQERGLEKSREGLNSKDRGRREKGEISGLPRQERGLEKLREGLNSKDRGRREEGEISGLPRQERGLEKSREGLNSKDIGRGEEEKKKGEDEEKKKGEEEEKKRKKEEEEERGNFSKGLGGLFIVFNNVHSPLLLSVSSFPWRAFGATRDMLSVLDKRRGPIIWKLEAGALLKIFFAATALFFFSFGFLNFQALFADCWIWMLELFWMIILPANFC
ncbi:hypothetical protein KFK09_026386 [Dendrobium nobile]|uniref:Uncharacterized protein n=1 Tax=Dendrobium nobile TaxID=94219 RepID=A0A8T3A836_DENNO|nr:hypothetical protein KFK09_026386 [Dendrobium nobile]